MTASKNLLDPLVRYLPVGGAYLVLGKLFSDGEYGVTLCRKIWNQPVVGLDDGLSSSFSLGVDGNSTNSGMITRVNREPIISCLYSSNSCSDIDLDDRDANMPCCFSLADSSVLWLRLADDVSVIWGKGLPSSLQPSHPVLCNTFQHHRCDMCTPSSIISW